MYIHARTRPVTAYVHLLTGRGIGDCIARSGNGLLYCSTDAQIISVITTLRVMRFNELNR